MKKFYLTLPLLSDPNLFVLKADRESMSFLVFSTLSTIAFLLSIARGCACAFHHEHEGEPYSPGRPTASKGGGGGAVRGAEGGDAGGLSSSWLSYLTPKLHSE